MLFKHQMFFVEYAIKTEVLIMNDLNALQKEFDNLSTHFQQVLDELLLYRKENPQMKAQTAKMMENQLLAFCRVLKQSSKEKNDDLMQGVSLLKIKMMC